MAGMPDLKYQWVGPSCWGVVSEDMLSYFLQPWNVSRHKRLVSVYQAWHMHLDEASGCLGLSPLRVQLVIAENLSIGWCLVQKPHLWPAPSLLVQQQSLWPSAPFLDESLLPQVQYRLSCLLHCELLSKGWTPLQTWYLQPFLLMHRYHSVVHAAQLLELWSQTMLISLARQHWFVGLDHWWVLLKARCLLCPEVQALNSNFAAAQLLTWSKDQILDSAKHSLMGLVSV